MIDVRVLDAGMSGFPILPGDRNAEHAENAQA
jgi:hypothetical protein